MAKNKSSVFLGYEDEEILQKHKSLLNYSVNKIGGLPDWSNLEIAIKNCPICSFNRPLILQCYAPLENSQFHRTLYVFACLNPSCSSDSRSWMCVRIQTLDKFLFDKENDTIEIAGANSVGGVISKLTNSVNISWCSGADDWGDDTITKEENLNEENGNIITRTNINDNRISVSDDDDESNSMEIDIINGFGILNIDDKNANCGAQGEGVAIGAIGTLNISSVYAEIEGEESELVSVESPLTPERDLIALMKQTPGFPSKLNNLTLKSFFIYVEEEKLNMPTNYFGLADHVRELIQDYQRHDDSRKISPDSPVSGLAAGDGNELENYEKSIPAHGDIMFHNFMTTIQNNPSQILRYSRDTFPLLISPITENIPKCLNCGSECICEIQILPSLIPKLKLENDDQAPIEYGNVLIFTCVKSCWDTPDKMRIENVIVQQEI